MFRILALLALLPTTAAADWSPRPMMFTFGATFDNCTSNPDDADAATCEDALAAAYVLKRAVAWATFECDAESLTTCAAPFEDEGLPAIAARIAVDAGCDQIDVLSLPEGAPLPDNHCITVASDIMIDEGVVPLDTSIGCGIHWIECGELAQIHAAFWRDKVLAAAPENNGLTQVRLETLKAECRDTAEQTGGWGVDLTALECEALGAAQIWADLAQQAQQDQ